MASNFVFEVLLCGCLAFAGPAAVAQATPVAPPPKPPDVINEPSLEVTLRFIADTVTEEGQLKFVEYWQNNTTNLTVASKWSADYRPINFDAHNCLISYHLLATESGKVSKDQTDKDLSVALKDVRTIQVMDSKQLGSDRAGSDHLEWSQVSTSPSMTAVVMRLVGGKYQFFLFQDESNADRVAKAITHAVELCGGGSKEPF